MASFEKNGSIAMVSNNPNKSYHLSSSYSMPGNMIRVLQTSSPLIPHGYTEGKIVIPIS